MWYIITFIIGAWIGFGAAALMVASRDERQ